MKKLLYVIAVLFVVGVLAGPKDSNTSARLTSAQTYGGASPGIVHDGRHP
jgi:hypothetical protein